MLTNHGLILIIIAIVCVAVISVALFKYFNNFSQGFSEKQSDWGAFGDYINPFLTLINVILLVWIGFLTLQTTDHYNRLQIRPLLDFMVASPSDFKPYISDSWYLLNCVNAPARNIRLKFHIGERFESRWIACYSMNGNSQLELPWLRYASRIEIV